MQSLNIYDENLNKVTNFATNYNNYKSGYLNLIDGTLALTNNYDNYYSVNQNDVTCIYTDIYSDDGEKKVTYSISEVNGTLEVKIVDVTTDGVKPYAGRT